MTFAECLPTFHHISSRLIGLVSHVICGHHYGNIENFHGFGCVHLLAQLLSLQLFIHIMEPS